MLKAPSPPHHYWEINNFNPTHFPVSFWWYVWTFLITLKLHAINADYPLAFRSTKINLLLKPYVTVLITSRFSSRLSQINEMQFIKGTLLPRVLFPYCYYYSAISNCGGIYNILLLWARLTSLNLSKILQPLSHAYGI